MIGQREEIGSTIELRGAISNLCSRIIRFARASLTSCHKAVSDQKTNSFFLIIRGDAPATEKMLAAHIQDARLFLPLLNLLRSLI
jgi:hypothetical protein